MIRFLLIAILVLLIARAFWRVIDGILDGSGRKTRSAPRRPSMQLVRDPVCGTYVPPRDSLSLTARGGTHFFCSEECRAKFKKAS